MRAADGRTGTGTRAATTRAATAVAALALAGAAMLFVLQPLSLTMPAGGLDLSWMVVLGEAATRPARWGVDLAFTYGPASALVTHYFTDHYLAAAVPFTLALALVEGLAFALLARRGAEGRRFAGTLILLAAGVEAAALASQALLGPDAFVFAAALTVALLDLLRVPAGTSPAGSRARPNGRGAAPAGIVAAGAPRRPGGGAALGAVLFGSALLGACALAKTSFGVAAVGLLAVADARALVVRRRVPVLVPVALLAALAAFMAFGQRPGDLPSYLLLQGQEASGYGEAMYLAPHGVELAGYLVGSAALAAVAALCGAPGRGGRLAAALATAAALLLGLKAGFVRADVHTQIAWSALGLTGVAVAAALVLPRSIPGAAALAAAALAVLWVVGPLSFLGSTDRKPSLAALPEAYADMRGGVAAEAGAWARFLRDPSGFAAAARAAKAEAWAAVRAAQPLPALPGGVDILPSDQSAVLAAGLDYHPRPSFQEYSTYAPALIAANLAFYRGPDAPEWVIFGPGDLDDRDPAMTEGALWPDLLRRYEPQRRIGRWMALHRRDAPLPEVLGPPVRVAARLGEAVDLPAGAGPTFARVSVRKTLLGRLAAALFRPPALDLRLALAGGGERTYRFIPALGEAGFLVSPAVAGSDGFADLAFGGGGTGAPAVTAITVAGPRWASLFYAPEVSVELRPVSVPAVPPSAAARALADALAASRPWRRLAFALDRGGRFDGTRLSAPAPTALAVPVDGARHLRVAFGITDGAWQEGATAGVCFAIKAAAGAAPLWRRCLDPKAVAADRGEQAAEVDLPPGLAAVTAETDCPKSCDWGWSYWSGITPEEDARAARP